MQMIAGKSNKTMDDLSVVRNRGKISFFELASSQTEFQPPLTPRGINDSQNDSLMGALG